MLGIKEERKSMSSRDIELTQEDEEMLTLEKRMEEAEQANRAFFEDELDDFEDEDEDEVFPEDEEDDGMPPLDFSFMY